MESVPQSPKFRITEDIDETTLAADFNDEDADIVLQTCDGIRFRVYRVILARASTVFKDMFTVPTQEQSVDLPVVEVTENAVTVHNILRLCYPDIDPSVDNLDDVVRLVTACDKYLMDGLMKKAGRMLMDHVREQPLRVFAIACRAKLELEAKQAAYQCLLRPESYLLDSDAPELRYLSASTYRSLLRYRTQCKEAAVSVVGAPDLSWITDKNSCWLQCRKCDGHSHPIRIANRSMTFWPRTWWMNFMEQVGETLERQPPLGFRIHDHLDSIKIPSGSTCIHCGPLQGKHLLSFIPILEREIQKAVIAVPIKLSF